MRSIRKSSAVVPLAATLLAASVLAPPVSFAQPYEPGYSVWSAADEAWYERNRRFALAGKILTIAGVMVMIAGAGTREAAAWGPGGFVQTAG